MPVQKEAWSSPTPQSTHNNKLGQPGNSKPCKALKHLLDEPCFSVNRHVDFGHLKGPWCLDKNNNSPNALSREWVSPVAHAMAFENTVVEPSEKRKKGCNIANTGNLHTKRSRSSDWTWKDARIKNALVLSIKNDRQQSWSTMFSSRKGFTVAKVNKNEASA